MIRRTTTSVAFVKDFQLTADLSYPTRISVRPARPSISFHELQKNDQRNEEKKENFAALHGAVAPASVVQLLH